MSANLVVMLAAATQALPVTQSRVQIISADGRLVYEEFLGPDSEGKTRSFALDTPADAQTLEPDPQGPDPYTRYTVTVRSQQYYRIRIEGVQMFDAFSSTLPVQMIPLPLPERQPEDYPPIVYRVGDNALQEAGRRPTVNSPQAQAPTAVPTILESVFIPSRIRIHLGAPDSPARTVTATFNDYIKNVACSEIYPTWPEESLRANIHAQISLALNRIFTEWYPSRGYDFDITNSTAYDQYYVEGRNIFDNVSRLVDEIFNVYVRRPGRQEPFFAEYCNGSSVSCAGMSQWGTVALAQQGLSAQQILSFYYGDVELVTTQDVRDAQGSYPGAPLQVGSSGPDVRTVQEQLNRVAINYPSIGLVEVDGVFGPTTRDRVTNFQRLFVLTPDGVVGKQTWYRLSYLYTAVKKLAELTSEGQREEYNTTQYPGFVLRLGTKGSEVQQIQFYLSRIGAFNSSVPQIGIDGIFGQSTQNVVRQFQRFYGLTPDGVVGRATWNRIVEVYLGTTDSQPLPDLPLRPYPGRVQKLGEQGEEVLYIQRLLNALPGTFAVLPQVVADGSFGPLTQTAVRRFQQTFGLTDDGAVGPATWERLNRVYQAVNTDCLFSTPLDPAVEEYPGYVLYIGSAGAKVRSLQQLLAGVHRAIPFVRAVSADGKFGRNTYEAVKEFQRLFGLSPDGSVGPATWELLGQVYSGIVAGCLPVNAASASAPAPQDPAQPALAPLPQEEPPAFAYRGRPLSVGAFGADVARFKQLFFQKTGISLGEGLLYGNRTAKQVEIFQAAHGLTATGKVDEPTLRALGE